MVNKYIVLSTTKVMKQKMFFFLNKKIQVIRNDNSETGLIKVISGSFE